MPTGVKRSADGHAVPAAKHFKPEIDARRPLHGHHDGRVVRQSNETMPHYLIYSNCDRTFYAYNDLVNVPKLALVRLIQGTNQRNATDPTDDTSCQEVCNPVFLNHDYTAHCWTVNDLTRNGVPYDSNKIGFFAADAVRAVYARTGISGINEKPCRASDDFVGEGFENPYTAEFENLVVARYSAINPNEDYGPTVQEGAPCPTRTAIRSTPTAATVIRKTSAGISSSVIRQITTPTPTPTPIHLTSSQYPTTSIPEPMETSPAIASSTQLPAPSETFDSAIIPTQTPEIGDQYVQPPNNGTSGILLAALTPVGALIAIAAGAVAAYGVYKGIKWLSKPQPAERYTVTPSKHQNPVEEPPDASEAFANRYSSVDAPDGDDKSIELANPVYETICDAGLNYETIGDIDTKRTDV